MKARVEWALPLGQAAIDSDAMRTIATLSSGHPRPRIKGAESREPRRSSSEVRPQPHQLRALVSPELRTKPVESGTMCHMKDRRLRLSLDSAYCESARSISPPQAPGP